MEIRLLTALLLLATAAPGQASRPVGRYLEDDLVPKIERMRVLMREGLDRTQPCDERIATLRESPARTMFRGSYDRHSNIAAHWALLSWARRTADRAELGALSRRFTVEALRSEREFIEAVGSTSPVKPYDDGWWLLLLREIERVAEDPEVASLCRELAAETESRLLDFLEARPVPSRSDLESRSATSRRFRAPTPWASGSYDSLLWPVVVLQVAPPSDPGRRERFGKSRADRVSAVRALAVTSEDVGIDFLWPDSLLWVSDALAAEPTATLPSYSLPPFVGPRRTITLFNCHSLGREIVKLWPLAVRAGSGDPASRVKFNERLRLCLARKDAWDGPFVTVSHWVPQFVYFAAWLSDGRP